MSLDKRPEDMIEKMMPERRTPGVVTDSDSGEAIPVGLPVRDAEISSEGEANDDRAEADEASDQR